MHKFTKDYSYFRNGGQKKLKFYTIKCCICNSVLLNLPKEEVDKLNNLTFRCECCGHHLVLNGTSVIQVKNNDSIFNYLSYDYT